MSEVPGAHDQITNTVTAWPGISAVTGSRGEWSFRYGKREIGHLHGDQFAHLFFSADLWRALKDEGRIEHHPVFPDREGPAQRRIDNQDDIDDVIALLRLSYDRAVARFGIREGEAA